MPPNPLGSAAYAPSRFAARPPKELPSKIFWIRPCNHIDNWKKKFS